MPTKVNEEVPGNKGESNENDSVSESSQNTNKHAAVIDDAIVANKNNNVMIYDATK